MPCRSDWDDGPSHHRQIDELTQRLCRTFTYLERCGQANLICPEDRAWWERHKEFDRKRKLEEKQATLRERDRLKNELAKIEKKIRG